MTDLASASAAPSTIKIGGEVYTISPLGLDDWGEHDQWMRSVYKESVLHDPELKRLSDADRQAIQAHTFDMAEQIHFFALPLDPSPAARISRSIADSLDGIARLLWMGIHKEHPDLTVEQVRDGLGDRQTVDELMKQFDVLNFGEVPAKKKTPPKRKTQPRKRSSR